MMATKCLSFVLFCAVLVRGAVLPPEFKRCKLRDPNVNNCLEDAMQHAIGILKDGLPNLHVQKLDPLHLEAMHFDKGQDNSLAAIEQKFKDLDFYGVSNAKISNVTYNDLTKEITLKMFVSELIIEAEYEFNGKLLMIPLTGNGHTKAVFANLTGDQYIRFEEFKKKGETYMKCTNYTVKFEVDNIHVNFENLLGGDKLLGDNMNKLMNENWEALWMDVRHNYELAFAQVFQHITNSILKQIPFKDLVLD